MAHIQSVIKNTVMPLWFDKPPQAFGEAAMGKLKADEWRSMSSIYLPLALVSLWARVLKWTRIRIVNITGRRTTTMQTAEVYRQCISDWTKQFYEVFPTATLRTNLHMAFHIYEFLLLFGPAYSWWTFPFESLIGVIQRTKSNHKQGAHSILFTAEMIARNLFRSSKFSLIEYLHHPTEQGGGKRHRRRLQKTNDVMQNPTDLCAIVGAPRVVLRAYARHKGTILARASTHVRSSLVSFYPGGDTSVPPVPGSIQYTFEGESHCRLAIHRQRSLPASVADPFRHWPHVLITLYSAAMEPELEIIELDWVIGHVGRYPYSPELVAIIKVHRRTAGKPRAFWAEVVRYITSHRVSLGTHPAIVTTGHCAIALGLKHPTTINGRFLPYNSIRKLNLQIITEGSKTCVGVKDFGLCTSSQRLQHNWRALLGARTTPKPSRTRKLAMCIGHWVRRVLYPLSAQTITPYFAQFCLETHAPLNNADGADASHSCHAVTHILWHSPGQSSGDGAGTEAVTSLAVARTSSFRLSFHPARNYKF
ncbi:Glycoside hydrolase family protein [Salix suchowensis]|nr:Glycoside hydrolase family protein [Salix suchowensis]